MSIQKDYVNANNKGQFRTGFPAILKLADGEPVEKGSAIISPENNSIDFQGEFVPLFSMGTKLIITRVFAGQEINWFCGEVYLSSPKLLRITFVSERILLDSEKFFLFDVDAKATIQTSVEGKKRLFHRKPPLVMEETPVIVSRIALEAIEFQTPYVFSTENELLLTMEQPFPLKEIPLEIDRILEFGDMGKTYFCRILSFPAEIQDKWGTYIKDMHLKNNQTFPLPR